MIKCFKVKCVHSGEYIKDVDGSFITSWNYIAKISPNNPNTFSVLDGNLNWIPFRLYSGDEKFYINHHNLYFEIIEEFLVDNKKVLNEYITTTKFYN